MEVWTKEAVKGAALLVRTHTKQPITTDDDGPIHDARTEPHTKLLIP